MDAPVAKRIPVTRSLHGEDVVDEYGWLRDKTSADTIAYLEAENAHTEAQTAHLADLREAIFDEIKSRTQETDLTAPARKGDHWYAARTEEGLEYPIFVRMFGSPDAEPEILLDVNRLAEGHDYLRVGVFHVSPDGTRLAYSVDVDGSEQYTIRIRDLQTGDDLDDVLTGTYYSSAWSADGRYLFYTTIDSAHRPDRIWRHEVGTPQSADVVSLHEPDDRMFLGVGTTTDDRYLIAGAGSQTTADARYLAADDPTGEWAWVVPRVHGVEYTVDHRAGRWLIATNAEADNGQLLSVAVDDDTDVDTLIAHDPDRKVSDVLALRDHIVVFGRRDGVTSITVIDDDGAREMAFDEPVYTVGGERNLEHDTTVVRIHYQSLVTPRQIIDVDLVTGARTVVKETPVLGGYDPSAYVSARRWATASDGTRVPLSIVHRADLDLSEPAPLLLYGYGSYEATTDPWFSIARLSVLDRGMVFVIAHVRGGGEMGKAWYERGKLAHKMNTFTDFIAAAEHLVDTGMTTPDRLVIRGGSAGGLLMGAVVNLRPDLFAGVLALVPFVDVINTMLDETLPLTVIEWEEWGNPKIEEQYRWIRAYSPYDNVEAVEYPSMLVTAGLNDPRVSYWEPAKWVAKLRAVASSSGPLLLKTEMGSGHGGPSGRYQAWRDAAFDLAFLLDRAGLAD